MIAIVDLFNFYFLKCSVFVVTQINLPDAFGRCSQIVIFLFELKLKNRQGEKWDRNQKLKI